MEKINLNNFVPYATQKAKSKEMRKAVSKGKITPVEYYQYYYSIPYRLRKEYGLPNKAPRSLPNKATNFKDPVRGVLKGL